MVLHFISHHQVHHICIVYKGGIHKEVSYQFNDVVRRMIPDPRLTIPAVLRGLKHIHIIVSKSCQILPPLPYEYYLLLRCQ